MAKANYVSLYGQVLQAPKLTLEQNEDGSAKIVQGRFLMQVLKRFSDENRRLEFSTPMIMTGNPAVASQMTSLTTGDMCYLKGVLVTSNITRSWICECGYTNRPNGVYTSITPIFLQKTEDASAISSDVTDIKQAIRNAGTQSLKLHNEISNVVHVIGTVCKKQPLYEGKIASLQFQIAVNRRYRLIDDDPDVKTDYPWVHVFGEMAREANEVLDINSTVFVDGSLFTKQVSKRDLCEHCGKEHALPELVSEIHPYSLEYLHNCNLPEKAYTEGEDYGTFADMID